MRHLNHDASNHQKPVWSIPSNRIGLYLLIYIVAVVGLLIVEINQPSFCDQFLWYEHHETFTTIYCASENEVDFVGILLGAVPIAIFAVWAIDEIVNFITRRWRSNQQQK